jgi:hypothetical protein
MGGTRSALQGRQTLHGGVERRRRLSARAREHNKFGGGDSELPYASLRLICKVAIRFRDNDHIAAVAQKIAASDRICPAASRSGHPSGTTSRPNGSRWKAGAPLSKKMHMRTAFLRF